MFNIYSIIVKKHVTTTYINLTCLLG